MKGEIGVFVLRMVECMASSPETLRIPRMDSKLSEDAAHKILLLSKFPRTDNVQLPIIDDFFILIYNLQRRTGIESTLTDGLYHLARI